jgi:hypothetical protein
MNKKLIVMAFACTTLGTVANAQVAYTNDFDTDTTADWTFFSNRTGDTAAQADLGSAADFFFDYSTAGVPSAPNSTGGSTLGMRLQTAIIGTPGTLQNGCSVTPNAFSSTEDFTMVFDAWLNTNGPFPFNGFNPTGGSGSTFITLAGVGVNSNISSPIPGMRGVSFGTTAEGGSGNDWRVYNGSSQALAPILANPSAVPPVLAQNFGVFAAGDIPTVVNNSDPYYTSRFPGETLPAAQTALEPNQNGRSASGSIGFAWYQWEIKRVGRTVTYRVGPHLIATVTNGIFQTPGDKIFFAQSDINTGLSTNPWSLQFQFGLIDNLVVTLLPKISGQIELQNTADDGLPGTEAITWTLSNGTDEFTGTVNVDDFGGGAYSFTVPSAAPNGAYTLKFKGGTFLSSTLNLTLSGNSITSQNVSLRNGDIDQDTEVGPGDFETVVGQFGGPGTGDVDNDGEVGPSDFEIVISNFGLGDE